jgi:hypothetical protein
MYHWKSLWLKSLFPTMIFLRSVYRVLHNSLPLWVWKYLFGRICHQLNVTWLAFTKYAPSSDFLAPGRSFYMIRLIPGGKDSKMKSKIPTKLLDPHPHSWNDLTKVNEQETQLNTRTLGSARSTDTDTLSVICDAKRQWYGLSPIKACFGIADSFEKLL